MGDPDRHALQAEGTVTVAALMAAGELARLPAECEALVARGASAADLREAAYVAALFCGFPLGVAALVELQKLADPPTNGPQTPPAVHRDRVAEDRPALRARGERLFRDVHQANADRQLRMLDSIHPDFAETVLVEAYGRVLAREFLPLPVRELGGVAALTVLGLERQLRAHLLGARNSGASWGEIEDAVDHAAQLVGADASTASALIAELRAREVTA